MNRLTLHTLIQVNAQQTFLAEKIEIEL